MNHVLFSQCSVVTSETLLVIRQVFPVGQAFLLCCWNCLYFVVQKGEVFRQIPHGWGGKMNCAIDAWNANKVVFAQEGNVLKFNANKS